VPLVFSVLTRQQPLAMYIAIRNNASNATV
jgi:hypothetical protein